MAVTTVVEALDGCILDRAVHPLDLTVRPWVTQVGQPMLDVDRAGHFEGVAAKEHLLRPHLLDVLGVHPVPSGSVKCVPLSVSTVWIL